MFAEKNVLDGKDFRKELFVRILNREFITKDSSCGGILGTLELTTKEEKQYRKHYEAYLIIFQCFNKIAEFLDAILTLKDFEKALSHL